MTLTHANVGRRIAVVLFNLGGPDDQASVRPFLFNLFNDPAIIGLPSLFRTPLARLISGRRETSAQANYALMGLEGGGSPLLRETQAQMAALDVALADRLGGDEVRTFVAMRYWDPLTEATARQVEAFQPDELVLLPLYPQYSTTTTRSSLRLWNQTYQGPGRSRTVCCYPAERGWIEAQASAIRSALDAVRPDPIRVLFSAHGIPEKLIRSQGDPYQEQVETTVAAVAAAAGIGDHTICYQSRVGPLKWLGPSTPEALEQAAADGVGVIVVPIAFVSEHIETLVELDIEYGELAHRLGIRIYRRVPTVSADAAFIDGLAQAVVGALAREGCAPAGQGCKARWKACPHRHPETVA